MSRETREQFADEFAKRRQQRKRDQIREKKEERLSKSRAAVEEEKYLIDPAVKKNVLSLVQSPQMPAVSLKPLDKLLCNPNLTPPTPKTLTNLLEDIEILLELLRGCVELPQKCKYL